MRTQSLFLAASLMAFGCASDPAKDVHDAQSARNQESRDYELRQAELAQKSAPNNGIETDKQRDERVETDRKHEQNMAEANREVSDAYTKLHADRREFDAKVEERQLKANAKAEELRDKASRATEKKRAEFEPLWKAYVNKRDDVAHQRAALVNATHDSWDSARKDMDKALDDLDKSVKELKKPL